MTYPNQPGYQQTDTSIQAAEDIKSKASILRTQAYETLKEFIFGATADEVAERMNEHILSVRPRFSELKLKGKITDSGRRGKTSLGKTAIVWLAI